MTDPTPVTPPAARWEHFHHGADIGVRGVGPSLAAAFEQAALALTAVITEPDTVRPLQRVDISCRAGDAELLLVEWLNALVFETATRQMLFSRFSVAVDNDRLRAEAWGEPIDIDRHQPTIEIKGATLTALVVERRDSGWLAQCVVDV